MGKYLRLIRVKQYIKNLLVFLPIVFAGVFFDANNLCVCALAFASFSLASSSIYIFNDIRDVERDRNHPTKKKRPIASGAVSVKNAIAVMVICLIYSFCLLVPIGNILAYVLVFSYISVNILYSLGMKDIPILDVFVLALGFVMRVFLGGIVTGIEISQWLFLVTLTASLYMGLGKRRNELVHKPDSRKVLSYYSVDFLDKYMYVCATLLIVFFALWTVSSPSNGMIWTTPIVLAVLMRYNLDLEMKDDGDPTEVFFGDKVLISLVVVFIGIVACILYL